MDQNEKKLWELYKQTGRKELLEKIVNDNLRLVHYIVNRLNIYTYSTLDKDDLYSVGVLGLLEAIERFDLEKGVEFHTYASIRIKGAVIDEIRKLDWVPRSVRHKAKKIDVATQKLFQSLGRMPSDGEIAEELEISLEEYYTITDNMSSLFLVSLDALNDYDNEQDMKNSIKDNSILDEGQKRFMKKTREKLTDAIGLLPEKEKLVISLYYYEELTLKEIGSVLDVSESRISQIHSSAINKLKNAVEELHECYFDF